MGRGGCRGSQYFTKFLNTWKDCVESFLELEKRSWVGRGGVRVEAGEGREKRERERASAQDLGNGFKPALGGPGQPL